MDEGNLPILVDAKTEYTKQLINILSPDIYFGIKKIYNDSKNKAMEKELPSNALSLFQESLSEIPNWNQHIINDKYESIMLNSKCDWLEDLITAVFVSHTRILTSINFSKNKNKINLQIPKVDYFIHQCFIEVAREFWKNPYLFDDSVNNFEYQRNRRDAEHIIESTIGETIRKQLPVKNILKEYLGNDYSEEDNETIDKPNKLTDNLRKMVKNEIENCSKEKLSALNIERQENELDNLDDDNKITKEEINEFEKVDTEFLEKDNKIFDDSGNELKVEKVDNQIEVDDLDKLINSEVDKIDLVSENDFNLDAKKIDDNIQDLSSLKEVYIDEEKDLDKKENSENSENILKSDNESSTLLDLESNNTDKNKEPSDITLENPSVNALDSASVNESVNTSDSTSDTKLSNTSETSSDSRSDSTSVNSSETSSDSRSDSTSENKSDITLTNTTVNEPINLENKSDLIFSSLDELDFDINNLESDNEDESLIKPTVTNDQVSIETNVKDNEPNLSIDSITTNENTSNVNDENVKTIIIDTKQVYDKKKSNDESLDFLENKDEDKDIKLRKKVLSKYGKKKDYSFFEDAITS
tara:strand:- start:1764 stop:3521 length:1758 start_codon:yes stop_codon:yes gene_type:complete